MRIAIVGAGVSGLATAKVLTTTGHDVTVFEKCDDIGGVWSASRRYPSVSTQDDRVTYSYSDFPMPASYPEYPSGELVQEYLERYAEHNGLHPLIEFGTEVLSAELVDDDARWDLQVAGPTGRSEESFDYLVAAHGTYSSAHVPEWPGRSEFEAAGGIVVTPSSLGTGALLDGRDVVIVGWGKTACDLAVVAAQRARSATLVVRQVHWKYPKRIGRRLTAQHLLLTRVGEHLIAAPYRSTLGRLGNQVTRLPRKMLALLLARSVARQLGLAELGLLPSTPFSDANSLVSEGFYEAVRAGRLRVVRDSSVVDARSRFGLPEVLLSGGETLAAEVLIPATGYQQQLKFFAPPTRQRLTEPAGELLLYRKVLPTAVPRVAFIGWSQSYRSPLLAEVQASWLAGLLLGSVQLPSTASQGRRASRYHLTHARAAAAGLPQMPSGSFYELDVLLEDLGQPLPRRVRHNQMSRFNDPADYAFVHDAPARRAASSTA